MLTFVSVESKLVYQTQRNAILWNYWNFGFDRKTQWIWRTSKEVVVEYLEFVYLET